ncbi:MAG: YigZ family protein [Flavobacteriales bacterium]|nr:YigZ family protein [Flavobacteriales bacterium]
MIEKDTYNCIIEPETESLFKDRGSKFVGYSFYIENEHEVKEKLEIVKKKHHAARHHCYAYRFGTESITFRSNDDGEPSHSAGDPILGQIIAKDLTNVIVIVVRYFGGVKLGVGGLIQAYKTAAKEILDECEIVTNTINKTFLVTLEYPELNQLMRFVKEHKLNIIEQKMELNCEIKLSIRLKDVDSTFEKLSKMHKLKTKII